MNSRSERTIYHYLVTVVVDGTKVQLIYNADDVDCYLSDDSRLFVFHSERAVYEFVKSRELPNFQTEPPTTFDLRDAKVDKDLALTKNLCMRWLDLWDLFDDLDESGVSDFKLFGIESRKIRAIHSALFHIWFAPEEESESLPFEKLELVDIDRILRLGASCFSLAISNAKNFA